MYYPDRILFLKKYPLSTSRSSARDTVRSSFSKVLTAIVAL